MQKFHLRITDDLGFEVWQDIPGYEGQYQASTYGRIRSVGHYANGGICGLRYYEGKIIGTSCAGGNGYFKVCLCVNNKRKYFLLHRLIAKTFIPNFLNKEEIDHINRNIKDNRLINLRWATRKENANNRHNSLTEEQRIMYRKQYYNEHKDKHREWKREYRKRIKNGEK